MTDLTTKSDAALRARWNRLWKQHTNYKQAHGITPRLLKIGGEITAISREWERRNRERREA